MGASICEACQMITCMRRATTRIATLVTVIRFQLLLAPVVRLRSLAPLGSHCWREVTAMPLVHGESCRELCCTHVLECARSAHDDRAELPDRENAEANHSVDVCHVSLHRETTISKDTRIDESYLCMLLHWKRGYNVNSLRHRLRSQAVVLWLYGKLLSHPGMTRSFAPAL